MVDLDRQSDQEREHDAVIWGAETRFGIFVSQLSGALERHRFSGSFSTAAGRSVVAPTAGGFQG
jgi:hypothetical protein